MSGRLALLLVLLLARAATAADSLELAIAGTRLVRDRLGLPARLEGILFHAAGPAAGEVAGTYAEDLEPNLERALGFTGTRGRAVLRLFRRAGGTVTVDEIVTRNRSRIVGEVPASGAILVESTGEVTGGAGAHEGARGALSSRSRVLLGADFRLDTRVTVVLGDDVAPVPRPEPGDGLAVTIEEDGAFALRFRPEFKRGLVARMLGPGAVTPEALAASSGLSQGLLLRWLAEARAFAELRESIAKGEKDPAAAAPSPAVDRSSEERLGVVIRAALYSEGERDGFLAESGVSRAELARWRDEVVAAIEAAGATDREAGGPGRRLRALRERLARLPGDG